MAHAGREQFQRTWRETVRRFRAANDAHGAILELFRQYRALSPSERGQVDELLAESLESSDADIRFDALVLIDEFNIVSALPHLRSLAEQLPRKLDPGAPFELAKVNRIMERLIGSHR